MSFCDSVRGDWLCVEDSIHLSFTLRGANFYALFMSPDIMEGTCRVCVHFQATIIRGADGVMSLGFLWQETEWRPLLFGNAGVTGVSGSGSRGFWKFGLAWVGFLTGFLNLHFQHPLSLSCKYVTPRFK
jgi:hypothetical protein